MKTPNRLTATLGAIALGTLSILGGAYTAPPVHAQPLAQAQVKSMAGPHLAQVTKATFTICLWLAPYECLKSQGPGAQLIVLDNSYAVFHVVNTDPTGYEQIENATGHCLRTYAAGSVGLAFGGCSSSTMAEWWDVFSSGGIARVVFKNFEYNDYMGTYGSSNGAPVYHEPPQLGFDTGWQLL